jgi:hypothetical protein
VKYIDRVWHFSTWSSDLFKTYIRQFLKLKIEASGWPEDVKTDQDKENFVQVNRDRYGIDIDPSAMIKNPVKRSLAKLCLNR